MIEVQINKKSQDYKQGLDHSYSGELLSDLINSEDFPQEFHAGLNCIVGFIDGMHEKLLQAEADIVK